MWAQRTADLIVLLHFFWILFLIFGAFAGRRHRRIKYLHVGGMFFALIIQLMGWYCPLTYLEVWLRNVQHSSEGYDGSFIIHYVEKIVYIELSGKIILAATIFLVVMSAGIYFYAPNKENGK